MLKSINLFPPSDGEHSYLYWLAVPLLLVWLTTSYLLGSFTDRPSWLSSTSAAGSQTKVIPHVRQFQGLPKSTSGYLTFWFDDAWLSQYLVAYPRLQQLGFAGVVAVPTTAVETPGYMNWAQLLTLQKTGWEITNHGVSHNCTMQTWGADQIRAEYQSAKLALWKHQLTSDIFVTPCGVDSQVMRDEAAKIFLAYRTVDPGYNDPAHPDLFNLKVQNLDNHVALENIKGWIDQARQSNQWLILVLHQLGEKSIAADAENYSVEPALLSAVLDYVSQVEIPVIVPGQVISASSP